MSYPHRILIFRPPPVGSSGQQLAGGEWQVSGSAPQRQILYEGPGDAQDLIERLPRNEAGGPRQQADLQVFLELEYLLPKVEVDDMMLVTWQDRAVSEARIVEIRRLEGSVLAQRVVKRST
jgi:hypothetical protein